MSGSTTAPSGARVPVSVRRAKLVATEKPAPSEAEAALAEMAPRLAKARETLLTLEWTRKPTDPELATIQRVAHELAELGTVAAIAGAK